MWTGLETKCATCLLSCGCHWGCLRGDDLAEIAELRSALSDAREALKCLDHPSGDGCGLEVIRRGTPVKHIIDKALGKPD